MRAKLTAVAREGEAPAEQRLSGRLAPRNPWPRSPPSESECALAVAATESDGYVRFVSTLVRRWFERHQHPASLTLHAIAIPMLPLAGVLAVIQLRDGAWLLWWRPVVLVVVSYFLQWIGHRIEGSEMGEVILIRKWLRR